VLDVLPQRDSMHIIFNWHFSDLLDLYEIARVYFYRLKSKYQMQCTDSVIYFMLRDAAEILIIFKKEKSLSCFCLIWITISMHTLVIYFHRSF